MRLSFSPGFMRWNKKCGFFTDGQFLNLGPFYFLNLELKVLSTIPSQGERACIRGSKYIL